MTNAWIHQCARNVGIATHKSKNKIAKLPHLLVSWLDTTPPIKTTEKDLLRTHTHTYIALGRVNHPTCFPRLCVHTFPSCFLYCAGAFCFQFILASFFLLAIFFDTTLPSHPLPAPRGIMRKVGSKNRRVWRSENTKKKKQFQDARHQVRRAVYGARFKCGGLRASVQAFFFFFLVEGQILRKGSPSRLL